MVDNLEIDRQPKKASVISFSLQYVCLKDQQRSTDLFVLFMRVGPKCAGVLDTRQREVSELK